MAMIPVHGQESVPINGSGGERSYNDEPSALVPPLNPSADKKKVEGFDLGVVLSLAYDDNIFLSSKDPVSDQVVKISPRIAYAKGDKDSLDGGYLKVAYRPTGVYYAKTSSGNRVDHEAALGFGLRGNKAGFDYAATYSKLGDATADAGRQVDRDVLDHVVRIAWLPREKLALEAAAGQSIADYADKVLLDSSDAFAELAIRYAYSPKTRVGLAYRAGRFQVDDAEDQTYQRVTGSVEWQPKEKLRVELEAGAEKRKVPIGSSTTPVMQGRITWTPAEKTSIYLTAYRRETASAFSPGQNYRLTGATAGVSQKIGDKWTARFEGGAERAAYRQVDGTAGDAGTDDLWFIRPSLEYRFTETLGLEVFYRVSSNNSTRTDFGYDQQSAGVSLEYKF